MSTIEIKETMYAHYRKERFGIMRHDNGWRVVEREHGLSDRGIVSIPLDYTSARHVQDVLNRNADALPCSDARFDPRYRERCNGR